MSNDPDILGRIDDTLQQWDEWDGHSPDAARWRGGPNEDNQPENEPRETGWPSLDLHDFMHDMVNGQPAEQVQPPPAEPLTMETIERAMQRLREATPSVYANPDTAAQIREAAQARGHWIDVLEVPHVPDGQAYIFRPPAQAAMPESVPYRFESQRCCHAGLIAAPGPCPWHGVQS